MGRIAVLAPEVAARIAAGEVIERPASIVKELCENAVDAGAHRVRVELEGGGLAAVAVTDDGCGMGADDAALCFLRHATSKLRDFADLEGLGSLGFRGEALPSIAAVSRVEMLTRPAGMEAATAVRLAGPGEPELETAGGPPGTRVVARDIFFNMPARRAVLRTAAQERGAVVDVVTACALARPDVAFTVESDGREVMATPGDGALLAAAVALWGPDVVGTLLPVCARDGGWVLEGLCSAPVGARGHRGLQFLSVDGRAVRPEAVRGAVEAAYQNLLMSRRYPAFVLRLRAAAGGLYDANVHPSKREVRFRGEQAVRELCRQAVRRALRAADAGRMVPHGGSESDAPWAEAEGAGRGARDDAAWWGDGRASVEREAGRGAGEGVQVVGPRGCPTPSSGAGVAEGSGSGGRAAWPARTGAAWEATGIGSGRGAHGPLEGAVGGAAEEGEAAGYAAGASGAGRAWPGGRSVTGVGQEDVGTVGEGDLPVEAGKIRLPALRPLGQVVGTYIVAAGVDGLYLLDQHAAHERVFFERLATGRGPVVTQALVVPTPVTLTGEQYRCWEASAAELATAGFTVEPFGDNCVLLRAVPAAWPGDPTEGFLAVLARMDGGGAAPGPEDVRRAMAACRAAIKAGQRLAEEDIAALLRELAACAEPFTCPHGRPTVVRLGPDALGRLFRRR